MTIPVSTHGTYVQAGNVVRKGPTETGDATGAGEPKPAASPQEFVERLMAASDPAAEFAFELAVTWPDDHAPVLAVQLRRDGIPRLADFVTWANRERREVFIGIVPRSLDESSTQFDSKAVRTPLGALRARVGGKIAPNAGVAWVDIDPPTEAKKDPQVRNRWLAERLRELTTATPRPSMIVSSGRGLHAYYVLPATVGRIPVERIVDANRGLAKRFKGDPKATDATRLMRLPGSMNRKTAPPLPTGVVVAAPSTLTQVEFDSLAADGYRPPHPRRPHRAAGRPTPPCERCQRDIEAWPPEDGAHDAIFRFALAYDAHGRTEEQCTDDALSVLGGLHGRVNLRPDVVRRQIADIYQRVESGRLERRRCGGAFRVIRTGQRAEPPSSAAPACGALAEARARLFALGNDWVRDPKRVSTLIAADPGCGKSENVSQAIFSTTCASDEIKRIVYAVPTREKAREMFGKRLASGASVTLLLGRSSTDPEFRCSQMDTVGALARKHRRIAPFCRTLCPDRDACPWREKVKAALGARNVITTHDELRAMPPLWEDALVAIDENFESLLHRPVRIHKDGLRTYAARMRRTANDSVALRLAGLASHLAEAIDLERTMRILYPDRNDPVDVDALLTGFTLAADILLTEWDFGMVRAAPWESEIPEDPESATPALTDILLPFWDSLSKRKNDSPIRFNEHEVEFSLPNEAVIGAIRKGRVMALDATAPVVLTEEMGLRTAEVTMPRPRNLEIVGVADRLYGPDDPDLTKVLGTLLTHLSGCGVVARKSVVDELRQRQQATPDFACLMHYGAMRGDNRMERGVDVLIVTRWHCNLEALRYRARIWRLLLGRPPGTDDVDIGEVPFLGTEWSRLGAKIPRDPVLRAVVEQDRREMVQAVGRLRAHGRPDRALTAYILDADPVPGLVYDRLLVAEVGDPDLPAGLPELLEELHKRHLPSLTETFKDESGEEIPSEYSDEFLVAADDLRWDREQAAERRQAPLKAANDRRRETAEKSQREIERSVTEHWLAHPAESYAKTAKALNLSVWKVRHVPR